MIFDYLSILTGTEKEGLYIIPTLDVPQRSNEDLILVSSNKNGKISFQKYSDMWKKKLTDCIDTELLENGSHIKFINGKWRAQKKPVESPSGSNGQIQLSLDDLKQGTMSSNNLYIDNDSIIVNGTITDDKGFSLIDKKLITNCINFVPFKIDIHMNQSLYDINIQQMSQGQLNISYDGGGKLLFLMLKNLPLHYDPKKSLVMTNIHFEEIQQSVVGSTNKNDYIMITINNQNNIFKFSLSFLIL